MIRPHNLFCLINISNCRLFVVGQWTDSLNRSIRWLALRESQVHTPSFRILIIDFPRVNKLGKCQQAAYYRYSDELRRCVFGFYGLIFYSASRPATCISLGPGAIPNINIHCFGIRGPKSCTFLHLFDQPCDDGMRTVRFVKTSGIGI